METSEGLWPVIRDEDGEHVGYLQPAGEGTALPVSLLGQELGPAGAVDDARSLVAALGLQRVSECFEVRAPVPLPPATVPLDSPSEEWEWQKVQLLELRGSTAVLRPVYPAIGEEDFRGLLGVPAPGLLRA